ncbi:hypothetical protein ApDm4_1877 [Acetobacter pomorum]|nr:hypothetical protein ApDm4_1877 [Acetobacter pomorum]
MRDKAATAIVFNLIWASHALIAIAHHALIDHLEHINRSKSARRIFSILTAALD